MEKKEISAQTVVKAIITGFVSYGIIVMFLGILLFAVIHNFLNQYSGSTARTLYITVPLMLALVIYFIIHAICKLSTYDVFKKCKTNPENYKTINKYLSFFFILCIILSICVFLTWLYCNLAYQVKYIEAFKTQYKNVYDPQYVELLALNLTTKYNDSKINAVTSTAILVTSLTLSFLSLVIYQDQMLKKYNQY